MKYLQIFEKKIIEREPGIPYLYRWNLLGIGKDSKYFSIKVHKIVKSDEECLHDHPWPFMSIILKGGYKETTKWTPEVYNWRGDYFCHKNGCYTVHKYFKAGDVLKRPAHWFHQLELIDNKPCWTLVLTFKKIKSWGFLTKNGFINWRNYNQNEHC